jgi:hypothetical protein
MGASVDERLRSVLSDPVGGYRLGFALQLQLDPLPRGRALEALDQAGGGDDLAALRLFLQPGRDVDDVADRGEVVERALAAK